MSDMYIRDLKPLDLLMQTVLLTIFIGISSFSYGQDLKCIWDSIPCCQSTKTKAAFPDEIPRDSFTELEKLKKLTIYKSIKFKCENGERYILIYTSDIDEQGYTF